jgi:hypothetical protein
VVTLLESARTSPSVSRGQRNSLGLNGMPAAAEGPYLGEQMARTMKSEIVVVTELVARS